jgi:hypothetical protein
VCRRAWVQGKRPQCRAVHNVHVPIQTLKVINRKSQGSYILYMYFQRMRCFKWVLESTACTCNRSMYWSSAHITAQCSYICDVIEVTVCCLQETLRQDVGTCWVPEMVPISCATTFHSDSKYCIMY